MNKNNCKETNKLDCKISEDLSDTNDNYQVTKNTDKSKKRNRKLKLDDDNNSKIDFNDTQKLLSSLNINDSNIQKISFCISNQRIESEHIQNILSFRYISVFVKFI